MCSYNSGKKLVKLFVMDLFSLFILTHENNEIKSPTKIYDFTVLHFHCKNNSYLLDSYLSIYQYNRDIYTQLIVLLIAVQTLPNMQQPWALNLPGRSTQGNYLIIQSLGTARF